MKNFISYTVILLSVICLANINIYSQTIVYVPGTSSTAPNYATVNSALLDPSDNLRIVLTSPVSSPPGGFNFPAGHAGRIVEFYGNDTLTAIIDGGGLSGTTSMMGNGSPAAVYNLSDRLGTLKFTNVKVVNARTAGNGSILNTNSPVSVIAEGSVFDGNSAAIDGGLMYIRHNSGIPNPIVFSNSKLRNNTALRAGIGYLQNTGIIVSVELNNCDIDNNSATGVYGDNPNAGGLFSIFPNSSIFGSSIIINNSRVVDNYSISDAGLFYIGNQIDGAQKNSIRILGSTILRNRSGYNGSVFYTGRGYYDVLVQNSLFEGNVAETGSGGVFYIHRITAPSSSFIIEGSTFIRNRAELNGGVLFTGELASNSIFRISNNSTFNENTCVAGSGGVFDVVSVGDNVTINWSNMVGNGNSAGEDGGVLYNGVSGSNFTFLNSNCVFQNNIAGVDEVFDPGNGYPKGNGGVMYVGGIGADANFTFNNLQLTGNEARTGGGGVFYTDEAVRAWNFTMTGSTVTGNISARHGGALNLGEGIGPLSNFTIQNSTFDNNESRSSYGGGAIIATRMRSGGTTQFNLQDLYFRGNRAAERGGAICLGGYDNTNYFSCTMTRVNFTDNVAEDNGGALHFTNGVISVSENMFVGNQVIGVGFDRVGGGIYFDRADATIQNSTFIGNSSENGGGIYHARSLRASTRNTVFLNNSVSSTGIGGATFHAINGLLTDYHNCVFAGNQAGLFAGALYQRASGGAGVVPVPIVNCTFYNNATTNNDDFQSNISAGAMFSHTASNVANCIFYNNTSPSVSRFNDVNFWVPASSIITTSSMQLANLAAYNNPSAVGVNLFGNTNPGFVNVSNILGTSGTGRNSDAGLRIVNNSMVDSGTDAMNATLTDLAGALRKQSRIDMGAYESVTSLPVRLVSFSVSREGKTTHLAWSTTMEENSCCFEIQHGTDGVSWITVGRLEALNNSTGKHDYSFNHHVKATGTAFHKMNYYRLKMIDNDEKFAYSTIRSIEAIGDLKYSFYPNPVVEKFNIGSLNLSSLVNLDIVNLFGITVQRNLPPYEAEGIDVTNLNAGMYIVKMKLADGQVLIGKISIVK